MNTDLGRLSFSNTLEIKFMTSKFIINSKEEWDDQRIIGNLIVFICINILDDIYMFEIISNEPRWSQTLLKYWEKYDELE